MSKILKKFNGGLTFSIDDHGSGDEQWLLTADRLADDYVTPNHFDIGVKDVVIDIGAHVGRFSLYAAAKAKAGAVYAFEPDPRNLNKLAENIKINNLSNLHYFGKAVTGTGDNVTLYLSPDSAENSLYATTQASVPQAIAGITLANIFKENNIETCNFLKLDCEGSEYDILFSLPQSYWPRIDKLVLEYHDNLYKGKSLKDLVFLLSNQNFFIQRIKRGAWYLGILSAQRSKTSATKPLTFFYNYFKVYVVDLLTFCVSLAWHKIVKK